jgi:hypothetical protein
MIVTVVAILTLGVGSALLAAPASAHDGAWRHGHDNFAHHYQRNFRQHFVGDINEWHGHAWRHCGGAEHRSWQHRSWQHQSWRHQSWQHHSWHHQQRWQHGKTWHREASWHQHAHSPGHRGGFQRSREPSHPVHQQGPVTVRTTAPTHQPRHHQTHQVQTVNPTEPTLVARRTTTSEPPVQPPTHSRPARHTQPQQGHRKHQAGSHPKQAPDKAPRLAPKPTPPPTHHNKPRAFEVPRIGGLDTNLALSILGAVALATLVAMSYLVAIGRRKDNG